MASDIFKRIFVNENVNILIKISLRFLPGYLIDIVIIGLDYGLEPIRRQAII